MYYFSRKETLIFPLPDHAQTLMTVLVQETAVKPDPNTATVQAAQWSQPQALPDRRAEPFTNLLEHFTASQNTE